MNLVERARDFLRGRKLAYCSVFKKDDQAVKKVLKDLAKFCRANRTTVHRDDRATAVLEGRREVWLRIQEHLRLSEDELFDLYKGD